MAEAATIDLNADVGEGYDDAAVMPYVSSVNIACGAHAGDEPTIRSTVELALRYGRSIGAHPGYPDRAGFGRRPLSLSPREVTVQVADQVRRLITIARSFGAGVRHVKPHGAMYNQAATDPVLARAVVAGVAAADGGLTLMGLAGSEVIDAARAAGLDVAAEAFCDRAYRQDGTLVPRGEESAVIDDPASAARRAVAIALGEPLPDERIVVRARTLCLHADTPGAGGIAEAVCSALEDAGIRIAGL